MSSNITPILYYFFVVSFYSCASDTIDSNNLAEGDTTQNQLEDEYGRENLKSESQITSFRFLSEDNQHFSDDIEGLIDEKEKTILVELKMFDFTLDNLTPSIIVSEDAKVIPSSKSSQDFRGDVLYKVIAEDGSEAAYRVIVKNIRNFCFEPRVESGPVVASTNDQLIENLHIRASGQHGIEVADFSGVTISNCIIEYSGSYTGIKFSNADNLTIENSYIKNADAPDTGPLPDAFRNCIDGLKSQKLKIYNVKVEDGSSGIQLNQCDDSSISFVEGYNMRGPFPRGQFVQYDKCKGGVLENFSVNNDRDIAWTEDNISVYKSGGQRIRKGLIIGNNSPTGVGVLFEQQNTSGARGGYGGVVEDVDFLEMGNGVVSSVEGSKEVVFRRIRAKNTICGELGQARGKPSSESLIFAAFGTEAKTGGNKILDCVVYALCNPDNVVWPTHNFEVIEFTTDIDFTPQNPIVLDFNCKTER